MANLETLHRELAGKYTNVRNSLVRHKAAIGTSVERGVTALESGVGGGLAAAIDHYLGTSTDAIPEALIGPVPVVMTSAFALLLASIVLQKESWSSHLAGLGNGLGAASAYAEGLRFLKAQAAAAPAAAAKPTGT